MEIEWQHGPRGSRWIELPCGSAATVVRGARMSWRYTIYDPDGVDLVTRTCPGRERAMAEALAMLRRVTNPSRQGARR